MFFFYFFYSAGKYGILTPFFNGDFSGKSGRFNLETLSDVQELNLVEDRVYPGIFKGFRGGFVNNWSGVLPEVFDS